MKIRIDLMSGNSNGGKSLQNLLKPALRAKGYTSFTEFAKIVAEKTGSNPHAEVASVSRIMLGQTKKLDPKRAKAYAEILEIPQGELLALNNIGNEKPLDEKPFFIEEDEDVSQVIKALSKKPAVTAADLVKELLWLTHK